MPNREKIEQSKTNNYFTSEKTNLQFVSTGCTLLNCALGGGFVLGRVANIVGDKSTAKTGIATECLINFISTYPNGKPAYREIEAAWDPGYAEAMGLPLDKVGFGNPDKPLQTVEDFERDLTVFVEECIKDGEPGIYIPDSLDALSDEAEMGRDIGDATYGGAKAKQLSTLFRKRTALVERSNVLLLVISQVRDNIGAMFGDKHKRSGGKALDFYSSQNLWLAHLKTLKRTIKGVERPYGILVRAKVKKNKVAMPFRECDFEFHFGYGVHDLNTNISWLKEVNRLPDIEVKPTQIKDYLAETESLSNQEYRDEQKRVAETVKRVWMEIEETFMPKRSKYSE